MTEISNDTQFRNELNKLSVEHQRAIGKLFIDGVLDLADDPAIGKTVNVILAPDASASDIEDGFRKMKSMAIESYTLCGRDADWLKQASHFVAAAAAASMVPEGQQTQCNALAWSTAMNARMARTCAQIAGGEDREESETRRQYQILEAFLHST